MRRDGFTLLELLVVLAILGILIVLVNRMSTKPRPDVLIANVQAGLQAARFEAVKRNRPVVYVYDTGSSAFLTIAKNAITSTSCASEASDTQLSSLSVASSLTISSTFTNGSVAPTTPSTRSGLIWMVSGLPQKCSDNAGVFGAGKFTAKQTSDTTNSAVVAVASAGRVQQQ